jgi:hypothetical protein
VGADELDRVGVRRVVLDVAGGDDVERQAQLLEDRPALRAGGREQERRCGRDAHPAFRATQISSDGQRRAQSAVTKS